MNRGDFILEVSTSFRLVLENVTWIFKKCKLVLNFNFLNYKFLNYSKFLKTHKQGQNNDLKIAN